MNETRRYLTMAAVLGGLAHGRELSGLESSTGFLLASAFLMGIGALARQERLRRVLGAAIGAAGLWLVAAAV
jgi:urease accessory protein